MSDNSNGKITMMPRPLGFNYGLIFFLVILVYIIICIFMFFSQKHIIGYEVKTGSLSVSNIYEGVALRDENIITANTSGYVNYFATEGEKVGSGNLVCCIDESGALQDYLNQNENLDDKTLTDNDISEIKNEMVGFSTNFNHKDFSSVYDFKYAIRGEVLKFSNRNLLSSITDIQQNLSLINSCYSPQSGIVTYCIDGFENMSSSAVNDSWFDKEKYETNKQQLINNSIVGTGDPIYKLCNNENWSIIIQVDENRQEELVEEGYVKVKFLKNQYESWAKITPVEGSDDGHYIMLTFTNSMITFVNDRYINIELLLDVETGLKVPNSAIVEKGFFLIPEKYITQGGNRGNDGVLLETYNEDGQMIPKFVEITIYNIDEETREAYVDDSILSLGDRIDLTESDETFVISKTATLIGVYNINKGYADFKQVQILNQNDEYSIIKSNTNYGLVAYDYIVLDADSVETDELIYE